jgi:hypothetical protein
MYLFCAYYTTKAMPQVEPTIYNNSIKQRKMSLKIKRERKELTKRNITLHRERERDEGKEEQSHVVGRREERGQLLPWFLFSSDSITGCHL